jgi:uncharacterized protein YwgA
MDRDQVVLAALAAAGQNANFTPVQVQKLFFLLDREATHLLGGPHFVFTAYDYGPFDRTVYDQIEELSARGLAEVQNTGRYRRYSLTPAGLSQGNAILSSLNTGTRGYMSEVAQWVRKLSFEQLVASIYRRYPEMKANSVFRG